MLKCLKILILSAILVSPALVLNSRGQNYVGMNESEIVKNMDKSMSGFIRQRGIVNERWNYLKYESGDGLQTLLFFMDNSGRCFEMRLNFDKSLYSEKVRYNDDNYVRVSEKIGRAHV